MTIPSSTEQHRSEAPSSVSCLIITVSDTRTPETDRSGQLTRDLLLENGYTVAGMRIVPDEYDRIQSLLVEAAQDPAAEAVLLNGGTGIAGRDTTYEAVRGVLHKEMPGFGEIFRMLSFTEDIGSAAILSRAIAGVVGTTAVFSMPGSTGAVRLAMTRLIVPELRHVMREIYKDSPK
ncbi:molybdenum cofactor biosynthesis protein B [Cohnella lubricantis]|uniref:Molybdenum cofactor biosynthesis protein B n=1 Tax=Cohnella lubricantis TaxID=2163172 RepID=A0A841T6H7_9BACL|nr:molybdenum cofactor biosynthesis protein B [Cohnella lubricantis]MBB6677143.1 molybdenum cofactor biosynthesis protein MoaB [Cohnella lubricantis]MBP2118991.1 molybdenum cofactor biosynthesis protein B [Cohnella lubricantis]